jgi:hypothetical protein
MKENWTPFCLGEYQGVGNDSCFDCQFSFQCEKLAKRRKEMEE